MTMLLQRNAQHVCVRCDHSLSSSCTLAVHSSTVLDPVPAASMPALASSLLTRTTRYKPNRPALVSPKPSQPQTVPNIPHALDQSFPLCPVLSSRPNDRSTERGKGNPTRKEKDPPALTHTLFSPHSTFDTRDTHTDTRERHEDRLCTISMDTRERTNEPINE